MLMSNRPTASATDTGGPIGSSSVSIGNYKGVMLCNRPFAGASGAAAKSTNGGGGGEAKSSGRNSFICGTVETQLGSNVSIPAVNPLSAHASKNKKDSVLSRHKKWLSDLQKTKEKLSEEYVKEVTGKEEKRAKFMEREAKMRAIVRGTLGPSRRGETESEGEEDYDQQSSSEEKKSDRNVEIPNLQLKGEPKEKAKGKTMPAWALSESKAVEQEDMLEEMEEEDLLNFADNLDFDKYADDMELRVLMDQVKERIDILEKDEDKEMKNYDALVMEQQERNRNREKLEANGGMSNISSEEKEQWDEEQEVRNMADGLITDRSSGMREVHSTKSLAQLVKSSKAKASLPSVAEFDMNLVEPKIITHTDDEGMRLKEKNSVSKLPYMNRNPAV